MEYMAVTGAAKMSALHTAATSAAAPAPMRREMRARRNGIIMVY